MQVIVDNKDFDLIDCKSFYSRLKGLMFVKSFDYCLLFKKCSSIHTFFMYRNIDVVMTDVDNNVLYVYKDLKPFRIIFPKHGVYNTYEFPSGSVEFNLKKVVIVGDN